MKRISLALIISILVGLVQWFRQLPALDDDLLDQYSTFADMERLPAASQLDQNSASTTQASDCDSTSLEKSDLGQEDASVDLQLQSTLQQIDLLEKQAKAYNRVAEYIGEESGGLSFECQQAFFRAVSDSGADSLRVRLFYESNPPETGLWATKSNFDQAEPNPILQEEFWQAWRLMNKPKDLEVWRWDQVDCRGSYCQLQGQYLQGQAPDQRAADQMQQWIYLNGQRKFASYQMWSAPAYDGTRHDVLMYTSTGLGGFSIFYHP